MTGNAQLVRNIRSAAVDAFSNHKIERVDLGPGDVVLRNALPVPNAHKDILERFDHWVSICPDQVLVGDLRDTTVQLTYEQASASVNQLAATLQAMELAPGAVVAAVAGASCAHAVLKLACLRVGLVHVPMSPDHTQSESGRQKINHMIATCKPNLIVGSPKIFEALAARHNGAIFTNFEELTAQAEANITSQLIIADHSPGDLAAIYFTSGSTGAPKGVQTTRRMISAVQAGVAAHWAFLGETSPVIADWLPWHHVFGGLDNFFKMIWNGGSYYIRSVPKRENSTETATRIAEIRPTVYTDVPFGIALLLDELEKRPQLLVGFFERLELIFFAGAGMDAETWSRLNHLIRASHSLCRPSLRLASGYGATEAGSTICLGHEQPASPGEIGVPLAQTELRLVETDGRTELRVRGPHISPGYIGASGFSPMPLDDQGYLTTGDTCIALRPGVPEKGLVFDGRLAEDFKLTNGTLVKVGGLRQLLLSVCAPYLDDVAITGEARSYVGVLLFPSYSANALDPQERQRVFATALMQHNTRWQGSSMAVRRAVIQTAPPDPIKGEINDKGHLVQRQCLANRIADVKRLYALKADDTVLMLDESFT